MTLERGRLFQSAKQQGVVAVPLIQVAEQIEVHGLFRVEMLLVERPSGGIYASGGACFDLAVMA
jgi:hypothetical protein